MGSFFLVVLGGVTHRMADNPEMGRRLRDARRDRAIVTDRELSFKDIGAMVAMRVGRKQPYRYQTVALWFGGREPESYRIVTALGAILGKSPCYLAFGEEPKPITGDVNLMRPVPEETDSDDPADGVDKVKVPPKKPRGKPDVGSRGKHDRPVKD
jgi:hypothetical protein